jgi:hypothetical protein
MKTIPCSSYNISAIFLFLEWILEENSGDRARDSKTQTIT